MDLTHDFGEFWKHYPRKVGKLAAFREYAKARRHASAAEILAGVERYRQHLPDDLQFVCHARTWLHQGRWEDEYEVERPSKAVWTCPHTPACSPTFKEWCLTRQWSDQRKRETA